RRGGAKRLGRSRQRRRRRPRDLRRVATRRQGSPAPARGKAGRTESGRARGRAHPSRSDFAPPSLYVRFGPAVAGMVDRGVTRLGHTHPMPDSLFDNTEPVREQPPDDAPLAVRMRPRSLDQLVGQEHILGEGSALRTAIESGHPHSAILYGPPGAGKTTLARIAASGAEGAFEEESAVNAGRAEIRAVIERARERRRGSGRPTVLFLDEIHRFNKAQQDALLPAVEDGTLTLIGATTENPYFEVNSALLSRAQIYELRPLEPVQVEEVLRRALSDPQ